MERRGGCGRTIPWCKILSVAILIAFLMPTLWYIHGHFCATRTFFNRVEEDLLALKAQMECMRNYGETGTTEQLQTIGKDTSQKLALVEKILRELKDCSKTSASSSDKTSCCSLFDSVSSSSAGQADFALESTGGSIIGIGDDTEPFEPGSGSSIFGIPICCSRNGPHAVIQPGVQPGECWAFKGCSGSVTIRLLGYVFISGVSLEHIPKHLSPSGDINSAPNEFSIVGLASERDTEGIEYGPFNYNCKGPAVQFFEIDGCPQSFEIIRLQVHSNHGNPHFTCVYRLQVHGKLDMEER